MRWKPALLTAALLAQTAAARSQIVFTGAAEAAGIRFTHTHGGCGKRLFAEQVGGGAVFFDADGDGWLEALLLSGDRLPGCPDVPQGRCRLFRNLRNGRFEDAAGASGLAEPGYATGAAAGDFDNDGDEDLYIACLGPNRLYRNEPGGFVEMGRAAGVDDPSFSSSAVWLDFDRDGDLDLYVANYVVFPAGSEPECRRGNLTVYCLPQDFEAAPDRFYQNQGGGRFTDATRSARLAAPSGRGLGAASGDYDDDGWPDIFVANDASDNFLYRNNGNGTFTDRALLAGVAVSEDGEMQNGMGTDWGDFDEDGRLDLIATNFEGQVNSLWKNLGDGFFKDVSYASGTGAAGFPYVGWSAIFGDFDLDGRLDLFVANGHVFDNVAQFQEGAALEQPNLLFRNVGGGKFARVPPGSSPGLALLRCSRGAAAGDYDNDGDLDLLINNWNSSAELLRNDTPRGGRRWVGIECVGRKSNRSAAGARVLLRAGGRTQMREVKNASGYLSQGDRRLIFGLGEIAAVEALSVRWPGGELESFAPPATADGYWRLVEGEGAARQPAKKP